MKKKIIISSIALATILIVGTNIYLAQGNDEIAKVNVTQLKEKKLSENVIIPGTLKLADEQYVYYDAEIGDIDKFHVTKGSIIQIGTPIVTYKNDSLELEEAQNNLETKSSLLRINSLTNQIFNLNKKRKELPKDEFNTQSEQLKLDLETAKLDLEKTKIQDKSIEKKVSNLDVKSEIKGTVLEVNKEAINNSNNEVQKPIIHIGNTDEYLANGMLSEYDALKIKIGQSVKITSDVLPEKKWNGTVKQIDYLPTQQTSTDASSDDLANQYPVEVRINDESIKDIKPGFKLLLEIQTNSKKAQSLPVNTIVTKGEGKYVYVLKNQRVHLKKVKTGQTANKSIEILSGISSKDKVVLNPSNKLENGMEVKN